MRSDPIHLHDKDGGWPAAVVKARGKQSGRLCPQQMTTTKTYVSLLSRACCWYNQEVVITGQISSPLQPKPGSNRAVRTFKLSRDGTELFWFDE